MVLMTYTIDVPEGHTLRSPLFYKKKSLQPGYIEIRGRNRIKSDDDIVVPEKGLCSLSKEKRAYYNRCHYIKKKNGLVAA